MLLGFSCEFSCQSLWVLSRPVGKLWHRYLIDAALSCCSWWEASRLQYLQDTVLPAVDVPCTVTSSLSSAPCV